jgi:Tfp pilus assembly PilM family ATPase
MALKDSIRKATRRHAVGIDVNGQAVRIVALSCGARNGGPVRIECFAAEPLAPGAMAGVEIVDRQAVARALSDVFGYLPQHCVSDALRCAMAIPGSTAFITHLPEPKLNGYQRDAAVAPAVMMEAERIAGIERHALAIDWYVDDAPPRQGSVAVAATARGQLEARIDCASMAGITLATVDIEPLAAMRALRYAGVFELGLSDPYAVVWVGGDGVYGWCIRDECIAEEISYPSPEYSCIADALRELGRQHGNMCVLVGGEIELLDGVCFSLAEIGDVLGCAVLQFDCSSLGDGSPIPMSELMRDPAFAVAFGLALRGLSQ